MSDQTQTTAEQVEPTARRPSRRALASGRWTRSLIAPAFVAVAGTAEVMLVLDHGGVTAAESAMVHVALLAALACAEWKLRLRDRFAWAIMSSLGAFARGQRSLDALRVGDELGSLASCYNEILAERDAVTRGELAATIGQGEATGGGTSGELQSAIDGLWQGLALFDQEGHATVLNGATRIQLGLSDEVQVGATASELFAEAEITDAIDAVVQRRVRQRATFEIERGESGAKTILRVSVKPSSGGGAMVVVEDVTQQRAASDAQAHMIAHTTHELRTPLSNIRLYVEEALDASEDDAKLRGRCLNVINQETRRLERMVEDLLSASEIESGSLKIHTGDVRMDAVFEELEADYQASAADKNINLSFSLPPKLPVLSGDRQKLAVALHNLMGNAIKYTEPGGAVSVTVQESEGMLVIEVADTGIGIDATEVEHIFDRFFRSSNDAVREITGTGLGLTLAREVARLHGGDIIVESEEGCGSKFSMSIPLPEALSAAA